VLRGAGFQYRVATGDAIHEMAGTVYDEPPIKADDRRSQELWDGIAGMFPGADFGDDDDDDEADP